MTPQKRDGDGVESRRKLCEQLSNANSVRWRPETGGVAWLSFGIAVSNQ